MGFVDKIKLNEDEQFYMSDLAVSDLYGDLRPERALLCAVLRKAIIDLQSRDTVARHDAWAWFTNRKPNPKDVYFSYPFIVSALDLSKAQQDHIDSLVYGPKSPSKLSS